MSETKKAARHRPSILSHQRQKELFQDIADSGGLHKLYVSQFLKDHHIGRDTPEGKAICNKLNDCKRKAETYERLQVTLFGEVIDETVSRASKKQKTSAADPTPSSSSTATNFDDFSACFANMSVSNQVLAEPGTSVMSMHKYCLNDFSAVGERP